MSAQVKTSGTFTGWHMLGIMFAFFGVIISVNFVMAYVAVKSWSGLVVSNSYVASQEFNEKAISGKQQAALGWKITTTYAEGQFTMMLTDHQGQPVYVKSAIADFKRPVGDVDDTKLQLIPAEKGILKAKAHLADGAWILEINADAGLEDSYRHIIRVLIQNGRLI